MRQGFVDAANDDSSLIWIWNISHNYLLQCCPSYMAVMLNVTDCVDGFPFIPYAIISFPPYNQVVALAVFAGLRWHVSCDLPLLQNMSTDVFLPNMTRYFNLK